MLFLSFWASLSPFTSSMPICLLHEPVIHYSCHLGLMVLSPVCQPFVALVVGLSSFHFDPQKWPLTSIPLNIWSIPVVHMWIKDLPVFPTSLLSFPTRAFLNSGPFFTYIYTFFSCREQCCLFEFPSLVVILKYIRRFINFIPILMAGPSPSFMPALMT